MSEYILGKKVADKHVDKVVSRMQPHLEFDENIVLIIKATNARPLRDTVVVTNKRIIAMYRGGSGDLEFAMNLDQVTRVAFDRNELFVKGLDGEVISIARIDHLREDEPLVRSAIAGLTAGGSDSERGGVLDPTANLQSGPRTQPKEIRDAVAKVDTFLTDGEEILFMEVNYADVYCITNKRFIHISGSFKVQAREFDVSTLVRMKVLKEGSKWYLVGSDAQDQLLPLAEFLHEDSARWIASKFEEVFDHLEPVGSAVLDPTANVQSGPRTKPKQIPDAVTKVANYLTTDEEIVFMELDVADVYCITNKRFIHASGAFKIKAEEFDVSTLVRIEVMKEGIKWFLVGADAQHELYKLGELSHEDSARWLASKFEEVFGHLRDPWRDQVRQFIDSVGLTYAFEAVLPLLWPRFGDEILLSAFGGGEDLIIFTSARAVVLPDLAVIPKEDWVQLVFATGRHEHYSFDGRLLEVQIGMTLESRVRDGRRYGKLQYIGDSEQAFNAAIPHITATLTELANQGYPVTEGPDWLEQTQNPPPPPRQGPTSFIGYSVEF